MAFARDVYTAGAAQTDFTISFPYLDEVDVLVYVNGALQTSGTDYNIVTTTIVRFVSGQTSGDTVVVQRATSQTTRLVDYATASTLTEEDLDNDSIQAFYMAQESIDKANTALPLGTTEEWDFGNKQSENVPTPTSGDSVVNKTYVDGLVVAAGAVPDPDNPGEEGYVIAASAGLWDWVDLTARNESISGTRSFSGSFLVSATQIEFLNSGTGSNAHPNLRLNRDSSSPAAADDIGKVSFLGKDSGDNETEYAALQGVILDPTSTSEDGELQVRTMVGASAAVRATFAAGLYMDGATGGDQGAGTINATALYVNGASAHKWEYLGEYTASAEARLAIEDTSIFGGGYKRIHLAIVNLTTDTDDVEVRMRIGTGVGPTYQTATYLWSQNTHITGYAGANSNATAGTYIPVSMDGAIATHALGTASSEFLSGDVYVDDPDSTTLAKMVKLSSHYISANTNLARSWGSGVWAGGLSALTGIRFYLESGNITATVKVWGLKA
jgi:hypothetical protein